MQEVGRLRGEGADGEDVAGGGADVRAGRVPARGDGGGGARRAADGEAGGEGAGPLGAQVRPPAAAAAAVAHGQILSTAMHCAETSTLHPSI